MLFALGAASSAIDLLSSLTGKGSKAQKGSSTPFDALSKTSATDDSASSSAQASTAQSGALSPAAYSTLLAAQSQGGSQQTPQSPTAALKDLFSLLDSDGDGKVSKAEFESKLGAGGTNVQAADDVFAKLDKDGSGSVGEDELSSALQGAKGHGSSHHHHAHGAGGAGLSGSLLQALNGASSSSATNGDGSTSTTVTYADGSKVTLTSPASSVSSSSAASSYNFVEQLIQRQANALSSPANA